nr:MAG TPA: hypothetical protein [Caudoviricetes sp.]
MATAPTAARRFISHGNFTGCTTRTGSASGSASG